ncbi:hypothetical protein EDB83DRAFT_1674015 [Lactarius deliciosus]|nr:hypothetical protein EDB83DRAFT_1674015 [Lactarius deliciosus]
MISLKIIDFDVAIEVQDENTEVDEYHGTRDWTAPEMGEEDGPTPMYSPIKADRWPCGRVLLRHIMVGTGDNHLSKFAEHLMATIPSSSDHRCLHGTNGLPYRCPTWPTYLRSVGKSHHLGKSRKTGRGRWSKYEAARCEEAQACSDERGVQPDLNGSQPSRPTGKVPYYSVVLICFLQGFHRSGGKRSIS